MPASTSRPYRGVFPVVPTTFTATGELDLASQKRCVDFMIDAGSDGLCILANYSEQFALGDDERELLTREILEHVAGRVPVIVTTTHYSSRICAARRRRVNCAATPPASAALVTSARSKRYWSNWPSAKTAPMWSGCRANQANAKRATPICSAERSAAPKSPRRQLARPGPASRTTWRADAWRSLKIGSPRSKQKWRI